MASSAAAARDAIDLIDVAYDPLPALVDPEQALKSGAPLVHEELETNRAFDAFLDDVLQLSIGGFQIGRESCLPTDRPSAADPMLD